MSRRPITDVLMQVISKSGAVRHEVRLDSRRRDGLVRVRSGWGNYRSIWFRWQVVDEMDRCHWQKVDEAVHGGTQAGAMQNA